MDIGVYIFQGIISILVFLCLFILKDFKAIMNALQLGVNNLNVTIAKLLERDISKDKLIEANQREITRIREKLEKLSIKTKGAP